jgi:hypothetical protein
MLSDRLRYPLGLGDLLFVCLPLPQDYEILQLEEHSILYKVLRPQSVFRLGTSIVNSPSAHLHSSSPPAPKRRFMPEISGVH